jgi:hypothetical protein
MSGSRAKFWSCSRCRAEVGSHREDGNAGDHGRWYWGGRLVIESWQSRLDEECESRAFVWEARRAHVASVQVCKLA